MKNKQSLIPIEKSKKIVVNGYPVEILSDNAAYTNRFKVPSASNPDNEYTIAQRKKSKEWCCSCRGWIIHRHCKHLDTIKPFLPMIAEKIRKFISQE